MVQLCPVLHHPWPLVGPSALSGWSCQTAVAQWALPKPNIWQHLHHKHHTACCTQYGAACNIQACLCATHRTASAICDLIATHTAYAAQVGMTLRHMSRITLPVMPSAGRCINTVRVKRAPGMQVAHSNSHHASTTNMRCRPSGCRDPMKGNCPLPNAAHRPPMPPR